MKKFTELKDITGVTIKVRSNEKRREWTIIKNKTKYRTVKMNKEEYESSKYWTGNDWNQFLKTDEYFRVK